jgi:hypothetical protein
MVSFGLPNLPGKEHIAVPTAGTAEPAVAGDPSTGSVGVPVATNGRKGVTGEGSGELGPDSPVGKEKIKEQREPSAAAAILTAT